jgi:hypothetical protein
MAVLRWDLFDGTRREFERKKAHYQATEAGEQVNGLKQMVSFRIQEAYLAVEESRKHIELARAVQTVLQGAVVGLGHSLKDKEPVELLLRAALPDRTAGSGCNRSPSPGRTGSRCPWLSWSGSGKERRTGPATARISNGSSMSSVMWPVRKKAPYTPSCA